MPKYLYILFLFANTLWAQGPIERLNCSTGYVPMPAADQKAYVKAMTEEVAKYRMQDDSIVIPTVIHNLHYYGSGYIEDERIYKAFEDVNDALANRGTYYDILGVDTGFRLCLAKTDPEGNTTSGILHTQHHLGLNTRFMEEDGAFDETIQWDTNYYFNVYLCDSRLGVATFPWVWGNDESNFNGILVHSGEIGLREGVNILLHEIGHYLGLFHTFGQSNTQGTCANGNCLAFNDMVCDTPPDQISYSACLPFNSCGSDLLDEENSPFTEDVVDMVENYMDGSPCRSRFTQGQVDRMHWTLETYRPQLVENVEARCQSCQPIFADFEWTAAVGIVGENLLIENRTVSDDISYQWYVDDILVSEETDLEFTRTTAGVSTVRLEARLGEEGCAGTWSREKNIRFKCQAAEINLAQPSEYVLDSCYTLEFKGVDDFQWTWQSTTRQGNPIDICVEQVGDIPLILEYGESACYRSDTAWIRGLNNGKRERNYFTHEMSFYNDSSFIGAVTRLYQLKENQYLIAGRHGLNENAKDSDRPSFIRFWEPNKEKIEEWYFENQVRDSLRSVFLADVLADIDGSLYFLAVQRHRRTEGGQTFSGDVIVGKINNVGNIEWSKRFRWQDYNYDLMTSWLYSMNFFNKDVSADYLLIRLQDGFYRLSKNGDVLDAKIIRPEPYSTYSDFGSHDIHSTFIEGEEKIWFVGSSRRIFFEYYEPYTSTDQDAEFRGLLVGSMNQDFTEIQQQFYLDRAIELDPRRISNYSISVQEYSKDKAIVYWQSRNEESDIGGNLSHNIAMINTKGEMIWHQELTEWLYSIVWEWQPTIQCLQNGEILINIHRRNTNTDLAIVRLSSEGELIKTVSFPGEEFIEEDFIYSNVRHTPNQNILAEDGFLSFSIIGNQVLLRHIAIDSLSNCETLDLELISIEDPMVLTPTDDLGSIPTQVRLEDIDIQLHKHRIEDYYKVRCENKIEVEDYSLHITDTTYNCPDNLNISLQICRKDASISDTLTLAQYAHSPLDTIAVPTAIENIIFGEGESCTIWTTTASVADHHFLVNARMDYNTPFTLLPTFFDAHDKMEFEYRNNYVVVEGDCQMVATSTIQKTNTLKVFPNPTSKELQLELENGSIQQVDLYTLLGERLRSQVVNGNKVTISVEDFAEGIYLLEVQTRGGVRLWRKVLIQR